MVPHWQRDVAAERLHAMLKRKSEHGTEAVCRDITLTEWSFDEETRPLFTCSQVQQPLIPQLHHTCFARPELRPIMLSLLTHH